MIPTDNHSSRDGARVRLVVLHTTEGARTVESLGRYFQTGTDQASYHAAFDDRRAETYVDYSRAAWALRKANPISDNAAFCAFAAWTRAEWLRHPRMLELAAQWVAQRCTARGVPIRRLTLAEVAACVRDPNHGGGVIMHRDYSWSTRDGDHHDCGDHLPWDVILTRARELVSPQRSRSRRRDPSMELPPTDTRIDKQLSTDVVGGWCGQANLLLTANTGGARVYGVYAVVDRGSVPPDVRPLLKDDAGRRFEQWRPFKHKLPDGTTSVVVNYTAEQGMLAHAEYER